MATEDPIQAASTIQNALRSHRSRRILQTERKTRSEEEERKRYQSWNSRWGYDDLHNPTSNNSTSKPAPRMLALDETLPVEKEYQTSFIVSYAGERDQNGVYSGQGKAMFANGNVYQGTWSAGVMHGTGLFTWKDGIVYKGPFVWGEIRGKGSIKWKGGSVYDGEVLAGLRHGKGKHIMVSSEESEDENDVMSYDGEWFEGKKHGTGTLLYRADWKQRYEGEWRENLKSGKGTMVYESGNVYSGMWKNNLPDGEGKMMWYTRNEVYMGMWQSGAPHGIGEHVWFIENQSGLPFQTLNRYHGEWRNGKRHGFGAFEFADGSRYEGQWENDFKEGQGTFYFPDGTIYNGRFTQDRMVETRKPKSATYNSTPDVVLSINDVLWDNDDPDGELKQIKNLLLQYMSELKQIFSYYSQPTETEAEKLSRKSVLSGRVQGAPSSISVLRAPSFHSDSKPRPGSFTMAGSFHSLQSGSLIKLSVAQDVAVADNAFAISMLDFWKFSKDCRLPDCRLTLAEIDRIFLRVDQQNRDTVKNIHSPSQQLIFRSFLEGLVRLADYKYQELPTTSKRLSNALFYNVLPYACREHPDDFRTRIDSVELRQVLSRFELPLQQLFKKICDSKDALLFRNYVQVLISKGLVDDKLSISQVLEMHHRAVNTDPSSMEANVTNLDFEIIYDEFVESLLRVADRRATAAAGGSGDTQRGADKRPSISEFADKAFSQILSGEVTSI